MLRECVGHSLAVVVLQWVDGNLLALWCLSSTCLVQSASWLLSCSVLCLIVQLPDILDFQVPLLVLPCLCTRSTADPRDSATAVRCLCWGVRC